MVTRVPRTSWSGPLPPADPPQDVALIQLPTGTYQTRGVFAVQGGRFRDRRQFAATAVLVRHPAGDLLVDAGFGLHVGEHLQMLARMERAPYQQSRTAATQLSEAGYDFSRLLGVLVTHVHWDHVSGLDSLKVPVWLTKDERHYGESDSHGAVFRAVSAGHELREYVIDGPGYLGFPTSYDVHGDGSVVVVHAGGHTPGSVVVFVTLPSGERFGLIGDLTWQLDGINRGVQRPWLMRRLADVDAGLVRNGLERAIALRDVVHLIPSHDTAAYDPVPVLSGAHGTGL